MEKSIIPLICFLTNFNGYENFFYTLRENIWPDMLGAFRVILSSEMALLCYQASLLSELFARNEIRMIFCLKGAWSSVNDTSCSCCSCSSAQLWRGTSETEFMNYLLLKNQQREHRPLFCVCVCVCVYVCVFILSSQWIGGICLA